MAWSFFAFGAVYAWTAPPLLALSLTSLWKSGARPVPRRVVDAALLATLGAALVQLVPLPPAVWQAISPSATDFRTGMFLGSDTEAWLPLSLDPRASVVALAFGISAVALCLATRAVAGSQGRSIARWIAWTALAGALLGIGRRTLFPNDLVYGFWRPIEKDASPFGAIINRNHYAAWTLAALGVATGGVVARAARLLERAPTRRRLVAVLSDARIFWMLFAVAVAGTSIVFTASRSGFAGMLAAGLGLLAAAWRRAGAKAVAAFGVILIVCAIAVSFWARPERLFTRIGTSDGGVGLRAQIWRETEAIASRYPVAGVGLGAFPAAMTFYQTRRDVFFNHAHNQYLEIAAEGGLLLCIPLLIAAGGVVVGAYRGLVDDRGSYAWVRAGALAALLGIAVLSIWESPFHTPATLMIVAVAAGLASAPARR